jgi:hypothetical protein
MPERPAPHDCVSYLAMLGEAGTERIAGNEVAG